MSHEFSQDSNNGEDFPLTLGISLVENGGLDAALAGEDGDEEDIILGQERREIEADEAMIPDSKGDLLAIYIE